MRSKKSESRGRISTVEPPFDNLVPEADGFHMKTLRLISTVLAAGVILTGTARGQDSYASHKGTLTNSVPNSSFSLELKSAPTIAVSANLQLTGLLVDFLHPQETCDLFNPYLPAPVAARPATTVRPPVNPTHIDDSDDLAVHGASFVLLKLSFP